MHIQFLGMFVFSIIIQFVILIITNISQHLMLTVFLLLSFVCVVLYYLSYLFSFYCLDVQPVNDGILFRFNVLFLLFTLSNRQLVLS